MEKRPPNPSSLEAIAQRLIVTREALGLNQTDFARRAGIAKNTYNQYEKAVGRPRLEQAVLLCEAHNLTLDWIYRGIPDGLPYSVTRTLKRPFLNAS